MIVTLLALAAMVTVFGPAGAAAYAASAGLGALEAAAAVSAVNAGLAVLIFCAFEFLSYDRYYESRAASKVLGRASAAVRGARRRAEPVAREFERRAGRLGGAAAIVGVGFLLGGGWASLAAVALAVDKRTAMAAIAVGAMASGVLWTLAIYGAAPLLPSPWVLWAAVGAITLALVVRRKVRERRALRGAEQALARDERWLAR